MLNHHVATNPSASEFLPAGTRVRVRNTLGSWGGGFEVVGIHRAGYLLRRVSDGALLPTPIVPSEVRKG